MINLKIHPSSWRHTLARINGAGYHCLLFSEQQSDMKKYRCPKCGEDTIPLKAKYLAGIWQVIPCPVCKTRLCANPIILTLAWFCYVWAAAWFGFSAVLEESLEYLLYLIPVWLILDFLNVRLVPLSAMKPGHPEQP